MGERCRANETPIVSTSSPSRLRRWIGNADLRTELLLGASAVAVLAFIALMTVTVFIKAWPSFSHNSFYKWFLPGGDVDTQMHAIITESTRVGHYTYHFRAWPILWGTILTTVLAVLIAMPFSILAAIFIVEFAPGPMRR